MDNRSKLEIVKDLPVAKRVKFFNSLTPEQTLDLMHDVTFVGRPKQQVPPGTWDNLLILAGRSFGKSWAGSFAVIKWAHENPGCRIALVGANAKDVRDVMVLGDSGIIKLSHPLHRPVYNPSNNKLTFPNGSIAQTYSAETPSALRGPQFHYAWIDEIAKFQYAEELFDMLTMCLRLGDHPQTIITTTPLPTRLIKDLAKDPSTKLVTGTSYENSTNISAKVLKKWKKKYEGTRLGRQELYAEILTDNPNGLFNQENIDKCRITHADAPTPYERIVVAVDPAITNNPNSDATGIAVSAKKGNRGYLLADDTMHGSPNEWVDAALAAYYKYNADCIVYETNQGGDMVLNLIGNKDPNIRVIGVRAFKSKSSRAEPVSALYEQERISHVGHFNDLEKEICDFDPTLNQRSPNRLDSMVYSFIELFNLNNVEATVWQL